MNALVLLSSKGRHQLPNIRECRFPGYDGHVGTKRRHFRHQGGQRPAGVFPCRRLHHRRHHEASIGQRCRLPLPIQPNIAVSNVVSAPARTLTRATWKAEAGTWSEFPNGLEINDGHGFNCAAGACGWWRPRHGWQKVRGPRASRRSTVIAAFDEIGRTWKLRTSFASTTTVAWRVGMLCML